MGGPVAQQESHPLHRRRNPAHRADLAGVINNLGQRSTELGEYRQAHAALSEAAALFRDSAADNPAHHLHLAGVLSNLSSSLCRLDDHEAEFAMRQESVQLYESLSAADRDLYEPLRQQALARLPEYVRHSREDPAATTGIRPRKRQLDE